MTKKVEQFLKKKLLAGQQFIKFIEVGYSFT